MNLYFNKYSKYYLLSHSIGYIKQRIVIYLSDIFTDIFHKRMHCFINPFYSLVHYIRLFKLYISLYIPIKRNRYMAKLKWTKTLTTNKSSSF